MSELLDRFRDAIALDLMTLAQLHDRELDAAAFQRLKDDGFPCGLAFRLQTIRGIEIGEMLSAVLSTTEFDPDFADELAADFAAIYLTHGVGASPYESVWLDEDSLAMQAPMFEVRRCYAHHGMAAPDWRKRPDDHLVFQLHFIASLMERDDPTALSEIARFLDDHLLRWVPDFADRVAGRAETPFYAGLAVLTAAYLDELRDVLVQVTGEPRPTAEEVEQRNKTVEEVALPMPTAYVPGGSPSW